MQCIAGVKPRDLAVHVSTSSPALGATSSTSSSSSSSTGAGAITPLALNPVTPFAEECHRDSGCRSEALAGLLTNRRLSLVNKGKDVAEEYRDFFGPRIPTHVQLSEENTAVRAVCNPAGSVDRCLA